MCHMKILAKCHKVQINQDEATITSKIRRLRAPSLLLAFMFCHLLLMFFFSLRPSMHSQFLIIFKVPEIPKKAVPEAKVPVAEPKKPEPPPAKGTLKHQITLLGLVCLFK